MSRGNKERVTELTSLKDIEKQFSIIPKLFKNKESDINWEERLTVIKQLRNMLNSDLVIEHKESIISGLRKEVPVVIKSILSLRSSVASETLSLISDMSQPLGNALDQYTIGLILDDMLKCSVNTKKMITLKLAEATEAFLTHTHFHVSVLNKLCKTRTEKSVQLRQYAGKSIQTILEVHGTKDLGRSVIDAHNALSLVEAFLKKGVSDASPGVRDTCRSLYKSYHQLWPVNAENFFGSLDSATQKQLCRTSTVTKSPRPLSRSSTISPSTSKTVRALTPSPTTSKVIIRQPLKPLQPKPSPTSTVSTSKTSLGRSPTPTRARLMAPLPSKTRLVTPTTTRLLAPAVKSNSQTLTPSSSSRSIHSKAIPTTPSPTASIVSQMKSKTITPVKRILPRTSPVLSKQTRPSTEPAKNNKQRLPRTFPILSNPIKSEIQQPSAEETAAKEASELQSMLKNNDPKVQCQGISLLATRLKKIDYAPTSLFTNLPADVPSKLDLLIILMDLLTRKDLNTEVYEALMSWESIAGIFVYIMSLNYYCPTLVMASHQQLDQPNEIKKIYSKGLVRAKMFLKRNDPLLPQRLLDILKSTIGEQKLLDASVKKDMLLYPSYKQSLQCGLLNWMNEILSDYVGLAEDEDADILEEGSAWLDVATGSSAEEWFDTAQNIESYAKFVIEALVSTSINDETFPLLCNIARKLKLANPRVFSNETAGSTNKEYIGNVLTSSIVPDKKILAHPAPFDDDLHVTKKQRRITT